MKIGFITTIDTNIGDDFIRTGIENIIASLKDPSQIQYTYVNKHKPETAIRRGSIVDVVRRLPNFRGKGRLLNFIENKFYAKSSVYSDQDLIIQSGAPVLWQNCHTNEWAQPIWYNTVGKLKDKIPVINLAAGSCYPWEKQGDFFNQEEAKYAKDIAGFCKLTTTRDKLAHKLFNSVNAANTLMPCSAFFVAKQFENNDSGKYVLVNYMKGGGHFDWDQNVEKGVWDEALKNTILKLKENNEVHFICHSQEEVNLANQLVPGLPTHFPKTVAEYLDVIKYAKLGINNRMHASVAMGSLGVPAISICTDTRLLMLENIGMPYFYVKDVTTEKLLATCYNLLSGFETEKERLFSLKKQKFEEYGKLLKPYVS